MKRGQARIGKSHSMCYGWRYFDWETRRAGGFRGSLANDCGVSCATAATLSMEAKNQRGCHHHWRLVGVIAAHGCRVGNARHSRHHAGAIVVIGVAQGEGDTISEAAVGRRFVIQQNVLDSAILLEAEGRTTSKSPRAVAAIMTAQKSDTVIVGERSPSDAAAVGASPSTGSRSSTIPNACESNLGELARAIGASAKRVDHGTAGISSRLAGRLIQVRRHNHRALATIASTASGSIQAHRCCPLLER